jgi:hypothetical protein
LDIVKDIPGCLLCVIVPLHIVISAYLSVRWRTLRGVFDGLADLPRVRKQRAEIQAARTASIRDIARTIDWSILALHKKSIPSRQWHQRGSG